MIGFIVGAIMFSIATIYYRIKWKQCKAEKNRILKNSWQWQDWGE